jgi:hypothetical protein
MTSSTLLTEGELVDLFEDSFSTHCNGCVRACECGKIYFNPGGGWEWEKGELERLEKNPNATALDYAPGGVEFEGHEFCNACTCWHERAKKIISFVCRHDIQLAHFLNERRTRALAKANTVPVVQL